MKRVPMLFGSPGHRPDYYQRRWSRMEARDREMSMFLIGYESYRVTEQQKRQDRAVAASVTVAEGLATISEPAA